MPAAVAQAPMKRAVRPASDEGDGADPAQPVTCAELATCVEPADGVQGV